MLQGNYIEKSSKKFIKAMIIIAYETDVDYRSFADFLGVKKPFERLGIDVSKESIHKHLDILL